MNLITLLNRFEFYATQNKSLRHNANIKEQRAYVNFDWEELAAAVETSVKFPCLFLQTPEVEKEGTQDTLTENFELTFMVFDFLADGDFKNKGNILQSCKNIADAIYNRMQMDAPELYDSEISKTQEGTIKASGLIGWSVTLGFTHGYDGSVNTTQWLDLDI